MKRYIFPLLLCVLLPGVNKTFAQSAIHAGKVNNLSYSISPAESNGHMRVMLRSKEQTPVVIDLLNDANKVVMSWTPTAASSHYNHDFDMSGLPQGNYHVNINDSHRALLKSVSVASKDFAGNSGKK